MAGTALPVAAVPRVLLGLDMVVVDVVHQVLQELKELVTLGPATHQLLGQGQVWREALVLGRGKEGGGRQVQGPPEPRGRKNWKELGTPSK